MCGIAGFINYKPGCSPEAVVKKMLSKIRHRGPNQEGIAFFDNGSIGMVRLSIIDKNHHRIPYRDKRNRYFLVYNGEIYNHQDIRALYRGKYDFETDSDAETVLCDFIHRGIDICKELNGMYAFCFFDVSKRELYIVRDKAGEKPLYYTFGDNFFAFSSEIKALLEVVRPKFNKNCLSYYAYEFNVGEETLFERIYSLMPGEYIKIKLLKDEYRWKKESYWKIWDHLIYVPDNLKKIERQLTELIEDAIRLRTRNCAHRFGAFISGGVDSALVACIAKPDFLYTCHYSLDDYDELDYAKLVAKKVKRRLIVVTPSKKDFVRVKRKMVYYLDTPCTWTSFSLWMLLEKASSNLKVILSGDGADELFGGYHRYHLLHHDEQIKSLKAMERYSYLIEKYYGSPVERYARLVNRYENKYDRKILNYLEKTIGFYFEKMQYDYIHAMGVTDFYTTMQELLQFADRINMAFAVENRSPFLDYRLIQFAFSIPSKYKIRAGTTKWILKRVARKFIPEEIVDRIDKRGFSAPINHWFGWGKNGKYDRSTYKELVFREWQKVFKVVGVGKNGDRNY